METPKSIRNNYTMQVPFSNSYLRDHALESKEDDEIKKFRSLKNRYREKAFLIEIPPEEKVKIFLPENPLIGDIELVYYLETNNRKLMDAGIGVRQCHWCKPEENLHLVSYEENGQGLKKQTKFLAKIGGRNGNSDKRPGVLFTTKDYESFGDCLCPADFAAIRRERYNITTA